MSAWPRMQGRILRHDPAALDAALVRLLALSAGKGVV